MKYPQIGEQVRVKNETGLHKVINLHKNWGGGGVLLTLENSRKVWLHNVVTRHQKYITVFVIQQFYGRWEDVTQEEIRSEAIQRRKEYRENTVYPTRIVRRKELNDLYQKGE